MVRASHKYILFFIYISAVFLFFLKVDYPLSPGPQDSCTYYFIGHSNVKYLQEAILSDPTVLSKEKCAADHIVPCAMPVGKPLLFLVHTLFAALLPAGFGSMAIGQALLAAALAGALILLVRLLLEQGAINTGKGAWQYYCLPVLLFFALSGSQLLYSKQFDPPLLNSLVITLMAAALIAYQIRPGWGRACLLGLSVSLALTAHLSTIPFIGTLLLVAGISFFLENRKQTWKSKIAQASVAAMSILVAPLLAQLLTWLPTLWIQDPQAWKFTAYYQRPYSSYFGQVWWYVQAVDSYIDYSYPVYRRFIQFCLYPLVLEGPVVLLAAGGWFLVLSSLLRQGWRSWKGVLLLGPVVPIFWYTFQRSLFPKIEAVAPLGIYFSLLAGYAVWHLFAKIQSSQQVMKKGIIVAFLVLMVALQVIHVWPIIKYQGGFLRLRAWLEKQGQDRVVCLVRQGLGEAAGINTWGFEGNGGNHGVVGAWGMRPALSWKSTNLPRFVAATELHYLSSEEKDFLKYHGIDLKKPLVHFSDYPNQYYYMVKYLDYFCEIFCRPNYSWCRKIKAEAGRIENWHYETGVFIYQIKN